MSAVEGSAAARTTTLDADEFLRRNALSYDTLVESIGLAFGPPRLAALAGSVSIGFGNSESDIDVFAIVDDESVSPLPIPNYVNGRRIDVRFISTSTVRSWSGRLYSELSPLPERAPGREGFTRTRFALEHATRLCLARPLPLGDLQIEDLVDRSAVQAAATAFWLGEAARHWFVSRIVDPDERPDFVRVRVEETVLSLLEAEAAQLGEYYFGTKWLGEKLRRQGCHEVADTLRRIADPRRPLAEIELEAAARGIDAVVDGQTEVGRYRVALLAAPELSAYDILGRRLLSRWGMRGMWVPDDLAVEATGPVSTDHRFWSGDPQDRPPAAVRALVEADLCSIGIERHGR